MKIKLNRDCNGIKSGSELLAGKDVSMQLANQWVRRGYAEQVAKQPQSEQGVAAEVAGDTSVKSGTKAKRRAKA